MWVWVWLKCSTLFFWGQPCCRTSFFSHKYFLSSLSNLCRVSNLTSICHAHLINVPLKYGQGLTGRTTKNHGLPGKITKPTTNSQSSRSNNELTLFVGGVLFCLKIELVNYTVCTHSTVRLKYAGSTLVEHIDVSVVYQMYAALFASL